ELEPVRVVRLFLEHLEAAGRVDLPHVEGEPADRAGVMSESEEMGRVVDAQPVCAGCLAHPGATLVVILRPGQMPEALPDSARRLHEVHDALSSFGGKEPAACTLVDLRRASTAAM